MSRHEKKMKDKLDGEIKLAGLESLVPEELEEHLILNSNRLRTFEDARLEVMTYVEAKFGLPGSIEWLNPAPRLRNDDCFETRNCRLGPCGLLLSSHQHFQLEVRLRQCVFCMGPL